MVNFFTIHVKQILDNVQSMVEVLNHLFLLWIGVDCLIYSVCSYYNLSEILVKFSVDEKNQSFHDAFASDVKQESINCWYKIYV